MSDLTFLMTTLPTGHVSKIFFCFCFSLRARPHNQNNVIDSRVVFKIIVKSGLRLDFGDLCFRR